MFFLFWERKSRQGIKLCRKQSNIDHYCMYCLQFIYNGIWTLLKILYWTNQGSKKCQVYYQFVKTSCVSLSVWFKDIVDLIIFSLEMFLFFSLFTILEYLQTKTLQLNMFVLIFMFLCSRTLVITIPYFVNQINLVTD